MRNPNTFRAVAPQAQRQHFGVISAYPARPIMLLALPDPGAPPMTIRAVDHINIATQKLEETRAFFVDVLGLAEGYRPPFDFPGYWLYAGDRPLVHMQLARDAVSASKLSALNHFAFAVSDLDALIGRMEAHGVRYRVATVPGTPFRQAFVDDPNGVRVELNEAAEAQRR